MKNFELNDKIPRRYRTAQEAHDDGAVSSFEDDVWDKLEGITSREDGEQIISDLLRYADPAQKPAMLEEARAVLEAKLQSREDTDADDAQLKEAA